MSDPMAEIRASFFVECEELLEAMQDGLQTLYDGETDAETIAVVFRAVHSIKGGAGAFGLTDLVAFAHTFETALDGVRSGTIAIDNDVLKVFFQGGDVLADHVRAARDDVPLEPAAFAEVLAAIRTLSGEEEGDEVEEELDFQPMGLAIDLPDLGDFGGDEPDAVAPWRIGFKPAARLYETGNEPLFLFRALRDLGEFTATCDTSAIPTLDTFEPAESYISWAAELTGEQSEEAVREIFDFVDGLCELTIERDEAAMPAFDLPPLTEIAGDEEPEAFAAAPEMDDTVPEATPVDEAPFVEAAADPKADVVPMKAAPKASEGKQAVAPKATVRVDLDRIDRLVNLVGELVINQAMLSQSVIEAGVPPNSPVAAGLDEFLQLTRDIQESVMMIRAQPVKSLFQRMSRIVRESAAAVHKDIRLKTEGEATEIDKTVIELLAEPLMHMIRNSVDHGIETADKRVAAGKPAEGTVVLTASHRSGRVVIEISDDGAGINRERVRSKAIEKGIIAEDQQLTDGEIDMLIFAPGFSTAAEVSNLSGRGVGMDVVKTSIASLGGRITITNTPGEGAIFSISLPLTLAVLDGMVVKVEDETLVVPLTAIVETLTLTREDIRALGPRTQVVKVRDTFVPLLDLGTELGYRDPRADYTGSIVLLITHEDGARTALVVDAIEDQRQVVIKGLHDSYGHVPGVAAATILGDGQIALILDPVDLVQNATGRSRPTAEPLPLAG